jgi:lysophospholipid acyltransferase (LPLAT)-like uncharacterized protein
MIPKPFSRCVVGYGEPFTISREMPDAEALSKIAAGVDAITREVDRATGIHPPPPWEPVD